MQTPMPAPQKPAVATKVRDERTYVCPVCGEEYGRDWYTYNVGRCHMDCDHWLVEVKK